MDEVMYGKQRAAFQSEKTQVFDNLSDVLRAFRDSDYKFARLAASAMVGHLSNMEMCRETIKDVLDKDFE